MLHLVFVCEEEDEATICETRRHVGAWVKLIVPTPVPPAVCVENAARIVIVVAAALGQWYCRCLHDYPGVALVLASQYVVAVAHGSESHSPEVVSSCCDAGDGAVRLGHDGWCQHLFHCFLLLVLIVVFVYCHS